MIWFKTLGVAVVFFLFAIAFAAILTLILDVIYKKIKKERMSEDAGMWLFLISFLIFLVLCIPAVFHFHGILREEDKCHAAGYNIHNGKCYELIEVEL